MVARRRQRLLAAPPELPFEQFVFQHRRPLTSSETAVFTMYHVRRASLVYRPHAFSVRRLDSRTVREYVATDYRLPATDYRLLPFSTTEGTETTEKI